MRSLTRPVEPAPSPSVGRSGDLRFFLLAWVLLAVATASWSLATPLFASPDEPGQVVKAAAVARGELTGRTIDTPGQYFQLITGVQVPAYYAESMDNTVCFVMNSSAPADCAPDFDADSRPDTEVQTWIGRYPPLYYAVAGLPSLVADGEAAVLSMRVSGAVLCSAFYAIGLTALRRSRNVPAAMAAGWLAITPSALFFGGVVNSSGLEIAAGFATWCLLVPLVRDPGRHHVRRRLAAGTATAAVLLNTRPGSGLLLLLIVVCLAVLATPEFWRSLFAERRWLPSLVIAGVAAVIAASWLLIVDPTASLGGLPDPRLADPEEAIKGAIDLTPRYVQEQLAVFGLLNVPLHPLLLWSLGLAVAGLVVGGLVLARGRLRWGLLLLLVLSFALPVFSQVPSAARLGLIWQGRYGLPLSIGLPIVAIVAFTSRPIGRRVARLAAPVVVAFVGLVHLGAFGWALWRYGDRVGGRVFSEAPAGVAPRGGGGVVAVLL